MNYLFLTNPKKAEEFLNEKSKEIFGHDSTIQIKNVKRFKTFNEEEALNVLYVLEVNNQNWQLRASTSNFLNKKNDFNVMNYLFKNGFNQDPYLIPQPVAYLEKEKILFYKNVEGKRLTDVLNNKDIELDEIIKNCSALIKKFHSLTVPSFTLFDPINLYEDFKFDLIVKKYSKAKKICDIIKKIKNLLPSEGSKYFCHGDFNPNNILVSGNNICLIDFGMTASYYKEIDIASFLTHLRLMLGSNAVLYEKLKKYFLETYGDFDEKNLYLLMILIDSRLLEISIRYEISDFDSSFIWQCLNDDLKKANISWQNES